ncbi:hypothetical protein [Chryseobacterium chendengshani]|uniref:hypothetical protein n=1 Tax=Chryseobacterium sp. LJ668 TaxID=2864040 RepID=UPI00215D6F30|nr:hypothetical protein [Chryseobacterium sp. LJ668]
MVKKLLPFLILACNFAAAQMPNISNVWLNKSKPYIGTIGKDSEILKLKVEISEQNKKNDQQYFVAGYTVVENNSTKFEGKLTITQYKDGRKKGVVYGDYELSEEVKGKHSGVFTGKFIYTFQWNKKTQKIENPYIQLIGNWKSYDGTLDFKTNLKNQ